MYRPAKEYEAPWWATILHSFPHLDLTFQTVNSSFNLDDPKYKESLMFWAAAPVIWLLVTLVVFLMYFCYRCCQHDTEKQQNVVCLKWTMAILTLLCCGAVGVGLYGNEEANKGIMYLSESANDAMETIAQIKSKTVAMQTAFNTSITHGINGIKMIYRSNSELSWTQKSDLHIFTNRSLQYARDIFDSISKINLKVRRVDLSSLVHDLKDYSFYRRLGMLMVLGWLMLLCLILLVGIGSSSKCTLLLFCAFGIFSLVLCWMSTGLHLGASIGIGDFCMAPNPFFEELASGQVESDFVQYYVRCDHSILNPFRGTINSASDKIHQSNKSLNDALSILNRNIANKTELNHSALLVSRGLEDMLTALMPLTALVDCTILHKDYIDALHGICYIALPGILYLILSAAETGLFFSILVVLASKAWKSVGSKKSYLDADEDDGPFIPRPGGSSPNYYSYPRGRQAAARETIHAQRRSTPPPAYNSNEFYRQYGDVNPPDEYCGRESNA